MPLDEGNDNRFDMYSHVFNAFIHCSRLGYDCRGRLPATFLSAFSECLWRTSSSLSVGRDARLPIVRATNLCSQVQQLCSGLTAIFMPFRETFANLFAEWGKLGPLPALA